MQVERRYFPPVTVRSKFMLEIASEMVGVEGWPHKQISLQMRVQGSEGGWPICLYASDSPTGLDAVAKGEAQLSIINPGSVLTLAMNGKGPYKQPVPVRAITVLASYDQLAFAVHERTGLKSLADIKNQRYPLKLSIRGQTDHSVHLMVDEVIKAVGFSIDDLRSWGGEIHTHYHVMDILPQVERVARGEVDAIFDEGVGAWSNQALAAGMQVLPLEEDLIRQMEALGFRRGTMAKELYPALPADVPTLDFSGFTVFTRADVPDDIITAICAGLEARKDSIPRDSGEGPLPLDRMCQDTPEGPLGIPLHPAAERFWRQKGYIR